MSTYKRPIEEQILLDLRVANAARRLYSAMCNVDDEDPSYIEARNAFSLCVEASLDPEVRTYEARPFLFSKPDTFAKNKRSRKISGK